MGALCEELPNKPNLAISRHNGHSVRPERKEEQEAADSSFLGTARK